MTNPNFKSHNYNSPIPDLTSGSPFTITCPPSTDLWEKPPSVHSSNCPIISRTITKSSFHSARVTVSATWKQKYDQGGLCLLITPNTNTQDKKWVKSGIEYLNNKPNVSTVATYKWSDWSLRPTATPGSTNAVIEMESNEDGSLWVYLIDGNGDRSPIREVTWWGDLDGETECEIGVYAAKPSEDAEDLEVSFQEFQLKLR